MTTFTPLRTALQARSQLSSLSSTSRRIQQPTALLRRTYANKSSNDPEQQTTATPAEEDSNNAPIPSNKAKPTLSKGERPSNDLPQDVKKHNQEMEERYDRPYNSINDKGSAEPNYKQ
ncbi:hypothetical protein N7535_001092 [Penicillium sp. DV-2018c]|nr:hypothetical protein N7461_005667 [Penicillium sp. DV-2018c]KAJ5582472.1 hypothetical protein N7535_001092 [Penicillium sp. DV-2018c]